MRTVALIAFLAVTSMFAVAQDDSHASIILNNFGNAVTNGKVEPLDAMFDSKVAVYWVDNKMNGKAALLKFLKNQISSTTSHVLSFEPEAGIEDSLISTSWGSFEIEYKSPAGDVTNELLGYYTAVAKNEDGKWQIAFMHLSMSRTSG